MTLLFSLGCGDHLASSDNTGPPVTQGYVGSARCSVCHGPYRPAHIQPTYGQDWVASIHGRTAQVAPSETVIVADQNGNGDSDFRDGLDLGTLATWHAYTLAGGAPAELAPILGYDVAAASYTMTLGTRVFEVEKILGVGRHQQTYLTRMGNSLYVLPAVFHVESRAWLPLMPEHWYTWIDSNGNDHVDRNESISGLLYRNAADSPITRARTGDSWERSCAGCHVTGLASVTNNSAGEYLASFSEEGVACEACHGPGRLHDVNLGGRGMPNRAIVNPNLLTASQQRDICMSCHTRGTSIGTVGGNTLAYPWHPDGTPFLPAQNLAAAFTFGSVPFEPLHALQGGQTHMGLPASYYGAWSEDCQDCHSAHDTTNLSLVRMQVPTPASGLRDVVFTFRGGPLGSGGLMGDATDGTFTDICEVCHTRTTHFRNDSSTPDTNHNNGQVCTDCHLHTKGFEPDGGACQACHNRAQPFGQDYRRQVVENNSDGLGDFVKFSHHVNDLSGGESVTQDDCVVCHDQSGHRTHPDPQVLLHEPDGGAAIQFDGTGASILSFCLHCHDANGQGGNLAPFTSGRRPADIDAWWRTNPSHSSSPVGITCWSCHQNGHGSDNPSMELALEENGCLNCHDGQVAQANIQADFNRTYRHPIQDQSFVHRGDEDPLTMARHVECVDCHNPHAAEGSTPGNPPAASGLLAGVSGMDTDGRIVSSLTNGFELCYKCHADTSTAPPALPRVLVESNVRQEFDPSRASFHPIETAGTNPNVPSLIGGWSTSSVMTCWDCHAGATNGPHGSSNPWILRLPYSTADNTTESAQAYALCYSCHSRSSILGDASFGEHRKHIVDERAPCSTCHDAHGSRVHSGNLSGTHLINFRSDIVHANGNNDRYFRDNGTFHGACSLNCHGQGHTNEGY